MSASRLHFVASNVPEAEEAMARLSAMYGQTAPSEADAIVCLGGDGLMLQALHEHMPLGRPFYGMNRGSIGFLMNDYRVEDLRDRIARAKPAVIFPLLMRAEDADGRVSEALAINEVSLLRETRQAAKLRIMVDGKARLDELVCDGVLVATPAGSTAYNLSAHGPILPIDAALLALTPISAFRPRRWRGALVPHTATLVFEILEAAKRPVSAVADHTEIRNVVSVQVAEDRSRSICMLFDADRDLNERIIAEQFVH